MGRQATELRIRLPPREVVDRVVGLQQAQTRGRFVLQARDGRFVVGVESDGEGSAITIEEQPSRFAPPTRAIARVAAIWSCFAFAPSLLSLVLVGGSGFVGGLLVSLAAMGPALLLGLWSVRGEMRKDRLLAGATLIQRVYGELSPHAIESGSPLRIGAGTLGEPEPDHDQAQ